MDRMVQPALEQQQTLSLVTRKWRAGEVAVVIVAVLGIIAMLKWAEAFWIPVVAGALLAFALRPPVRYLTSKGVPRVVSATGVVLTLTALVVGGLYAVWTDTDEAAAALPEAARKLRYMLRDANQQAAGPLAQVHKAATELDRAAAEAAGARTAPTPAPVPTFGQRAQAFIMEQMSGMLRTAALLGMAALLASLLLNAGDTFRRKLMHLVGPSLTRRREALEILEEIDLQIQRYMLVTVGTNIAIGVLTTVLVYAMGMSRAATWGAAAGLLHFIPYVGTAAAAGVIGIAAFLQFDLLGRALVIAFGTLVIGALIGLVLQPMIQGRASRMNSVTVLVGLLFWGWLWGAWGMILAVPMLTALKAVLDRVSPQLGEMMGR